MDNLPTSPIEREQALLSPAVRASRKALDALLADDFMEIASTGVSFGKASVLDRLPEEVTPVAFEGTGFTERRLADDVVLVTYRATVIRGGVRAVSMRASIWHLQATGWRMTFHQGTPLPDGDTI